MAPRDVLAQALKLPAKQRAKIAHDLIASLEDGGADRDADKAWDEEIARRVREIDEGTVKTTPWSVVREQAKRQLRARRARAKRQPQRTSR